MCNLYIYIISGGFFLILLLVIIIYKRYQKMVKTRESDIIHHIRIQDRLEKELQYMNVEKKVMEKMLKTKLDAMVIIKEEKNNSEELK